MIERLRQVFVHAHNLHEQCRFYETLGFKLRFRDGDRWAQFDTGDASFALAGDEEALGAAPGEWLPVFQVPSLEVSMTEARAAGGKVGEVRDMGDHGRTVRITDNAGACFALFQPAK